MSNKKSYKQVFIGLQVLGAVVAVFGALWQGTESLSLSVPQFMMLYGVLDVAACEVVKRLLDWKFPDGREGDGEVVGDESGSSEESGC